MSRDEEHREFAPGDKVLINETFAATFVEYHEAPFGLVKCWNPWMECDQLLTTNTDWLSRA